MTDKQPTTIDELTDRVQRARKELDELLADLSDEQLESRQEGDWAISDHLAHLAAWERGVAEYLQGRSRAAGMGLTENAWGRSMDEVNDLIYRQNEALSASQARQTLREAQDQMSNALERLDDEDLNRDYGEFLPEGQDSPYSESPVLETIAANTYQHYDEHAEMIREKITRLE